MVNGKLRAALGADAANCNTGLGAFAIAAHAGPSFLAIYLEIPSTPPRPAC
jgi:hypothetical protein